MPDTRQTRRPDSQQDRRQRQRTEPRSSSSEQRQSPHDLPLCSVPRYMGPASSQALQSAGQDYASHEFIATPRTAAPPVPGSEPARVEPTRGQHVAAADQHRTDASSPGPASSQPPTTARSGRDGEQTETSTPTGEAGLGGRAQSLQAETEQGGEGSDGDAGTEAPRTAEHPRRGRQSRPPPLPEARIPRTGYIVAPRVPSPPREALKRSDQIRQRTGSAPEMHHAKIQQAVLRVVDAARDGQRQIVYRASNLARDSRLSLEEMAGGILAFVGHCVSRVRSAVSQARADLTTAVDAQLEHISTSGTLVGEDLENSREENQARVHERLMAQSEELNQRHIELQQEFTPYLLEAQANIMSIDDHGAAYHILPPPAGENAPPLDPDQPNMSEMPTGPQEDLQTALEDLEGRLQGKRDANPLQAYHAYRIAPVLQSQHQQTKSQLQENLITQARSLDSFRAAFTNYSLRLTTPIARDFEQDRREDEETLSCRMEDDRHNLAVTMGEHSETLIEKYDGVIAYLDRDLQPQLVRNLQEAGRKAARSFRHQGRATERLMINSSASLALAYPDLVNRVAALVPPDRFLNINELGPQLKAAWESARRLPDQQYAALAEQAALSLAQARESQQKQITALGDTTDKSLQQVTDVVTATRFDFDSFGLQVTGRMREGGWASIDNAVSYAERTAEQMLATRGQADGALANLLRSFCGSLNRSIDSAGRGYFRAVQSFKESQDGGANSVFKKIEVEVDGLLNDRSKTLHDELTRPDPGVTTGLVVLNVLTLGASTAVTAGYLIYSDADDDEVFAAFSDLRWPAQPALAWYFQHEAGYGDLLQRFDDCLSDSTAKRARSMFSADAGERAAGREAAIRDSLTLFGLDADARRALLQGFDASEREAAGSDRVDQLIVDMRDSWTSWFARETDLRMNEGYLRGDMAMVLSARMERSLRDARLRGSDEIFQSVQSIEQMAREELARDQSAQFLTDDQIQQLTDRAMQDFASRRRGETRTAGAISVTEARRTFVQTATADIHVQRDHGGYGGGAHSTATRPVDERVKAYVEEVITGGWQSEEALAAKQAYEFHRADRSMFGPSETSQTRFTQAFRDPELNAKIQELRDHPERRDQLMPEIERLRQRREERMRRVAKRLNPELTDEQIEAAGGATQYMAQQSARLFSGGEAYRTGLAEGTRRSSRQEAAQYGYELITEGRASITALTAQASRGAGTNEDLLRLGYTGRTRGEFARARSAWESRYGETLEQHLGIQQRPMTPALAALAITSPLAGMYFSGGETSGDLMMELEQLMVAPETDQDYIELAALKFQQQRRRGTGFLSGLTMSGTPEARVIDQRYQQMADELLTEAQHQRALRAEREGISRDEIPLPETADGVFLPGGGINPVVASLVFGPGPGAAGPESQPRFLGNRDRLLSLSDSIGNAAERYKREVDRQESLLLAGIVALAIAATVILMAFGVGFVLASVLVALGSGVLTMAVKSGMRGERYGWEEAATDVASTAIEVATAGAGGALAGGLGKAGTLARAGEALVRQFGKVGGVVVREAMVGAVSTAAQTAIQDDTYKDGPGVALGRILLGGLKGAAVSGVSGGVSESLGGGLNRSLNRTLEGADPSRLGRLGAGMSPAGRNMLKEGVSEALGGMAGEATGIYIEVISGQYKGDLQGALDRIGKAGLKDMVSATGRAGVTARNRRTYNELVAVARESGNLSEQDLRALRSAAVAAGEPPESLASIRRSIEADRQALAQLPPEIRQHARSMDRGSLHALVSRLQQGELAGPSDIRLDLFADISEKNPALNTRALLRDLQANAARFRITEGEPGAGDSRLREQLTADLPGPVRDALAHIPVRGLDAVPATEWGILTRALAQGHVTTRETDSLLQAARRQNPDLDAVTFLNNLNSAVQSARMARDAHERILARQKAEVLRDVPEAAIGLFARLSDDALATVRASLDQGTLLAPHREEALFREARGMDPTLDRAQFREILEQAMGNADKRREQQRQAARERRRQLMTQVPEALRDTLSVLPESGLVELHLRQLEGSISPAERLRLERAALRENPGLDLAVFNKAVDEAIRQGAPLRQTAGQARRMRTELLSAVPEALRSKVADVPILMLPDAEFSARMRSDSGDAVTLIIHGRPVVIMREGVDPSVLREEGLHALQIQEPQWARHVGSLDESHLQRWEDLPLDMQMALYRNKLELEINAHDRLVEDLGNQLLHSDNPEHQTRLRVELEMAQRTLTNLENRMREVAAISPMHRLQILAGLEPRPQWLDQPARLFSKGRDDLKAAATRGLKESGRTARETRQLVESLAEADALKLLSLGMRPDQIRQVLSVSDTPSKRRQVISALHDLAGSLPVEGRNQLLIELGKRRDFTDLIPTLKASAGLAGSSTSARQIVEAIVTLKAHHLETAREVEHYLRNAGPPARQHFADLLSQIGSAGRTRLMDLMGEVNDLVRTLTGDEAAAQPVLAGLIEAAAGYSGSQKLDLVNRTADLIQRLNDLPEGAHREAVVAYILDGFSSGADLAKHALDVRAAARQLQQSTDPAATLEVFASSIKTRGELTGSDAFLLHLRERESAWQAFYDDPATHHFATLLGRALPHLELAQRAALADLQPWFRHIVESESFQRRVAASGQTSEQAQIQLLRDIFVRGLRPGLDIGRVPEGVRASLRTSAEQEAYIRGKVEAILRGELALTDVPELRSRLDITHLDTLRHILSEARHEAVGATAEPDFNARVREEMLRMGLDAKRLEQMQTGEAFQQRLADAWARGEDLPEVHLENLLRQKIEYDRMITMAEQFALQRYPDNEADRNRYRNELVAGLQQKRTEAVGEIAATRAMLTNPPFEGELRLIRGFEAGAGVDQVWVAKDPMGNIIRIIVVEAKGPGASLGYSLRKGWQMSPRWLAGTIGEMVMRVEDGTGVRMLDAIEAGEIPISGVKITATDDQASQFRIEKVPGTEGPGYEYASPLLRHYLAKGFATLRELTDAVRQELAALPGRGGKPHFSTDNIRQLIHHGQGQTLTDAQIIRIITDAARKTPPLSLQAVMDQLAGSGTAD